MKSAFVRTLVAKRQSLPSFANRAIDGIVSLIPESIAIRLNPEKYGLPAGATSADIPLPPITPQTPIRLYIAPANFAGQGYQWARAAETLPGVGAVSMQYRADNDLGYPSDNPVPFRVYERSRRWQHAQFRAVAGGFTHVIVEAERQLFGTLYSGSLVRQVEALRSRGVQVAMLSHGSDLRLPSRHRASDRWSPFHDPEWAAVPLLEKQVLKNRAVLQSLNAPVFVSTPDLLLDWPAASWLPITVDPTPWREPQPPLQRPVPRIVHIPSNAVIKGTQLIEPIMSDLAERGLVEYVRAEGVPAAQMPALYRSADVVLDQFRIGNYGVAAIEGMAAGRVVVGYLHDQVRDHVRNDTGFDVPVVQASVETLQHTIEDIVGNVERYRQHAAAGPKFAAAVHDGAASAAVLRGFLESHHG